MIDLFKKNTLEEITYDHFKLAAFATMTAGYTQIAPIGIPSGDDVCLYGESGADEHGHFYRKSLITLRNYNGSLELLVTNKSGHFLLYSQLDGLPAEQTIQELYRQFLSVKSLVDTDCNPSFPKGKITDEMIREYKDFWLDMEKKIKDYFKNS